MIYVTAVFVKLRVIFVKLWAEISFKMKVLLSFAAVIIGIGVAGAIYSVFLQDVIEEMIQPRYELVALRNRQVFRSDYHKDIADGKRPTDEEYKKISAALREAKTKYYSVASLFSVVYDNGNFYLTASSESPQKNPYYMNMTPFLDDGYKRLVDLWNNEMYFPPSVHLHHNKNHILCVLQRASDGSRAISCAEIYSAMIEARGKKVISLFSILITLLLAAFLPLIILYRETFSKKATILEKMVDQQTKQLQHALFQAEEASEVKSQFIANVSHELRTPLNAIVGFSEMMKEEMFGPMNNPSYLEYAELIHSSGVSLKDMINQILDVSKFEAGFLTYHPEWVNLKALTDEALLVIYGYPEASKREIRNNIPANIPVLWTDKNVMMHVFLNLLSNAVKYTREDGKISVSAEINDKSELSVLFIDNGIGISSENQEKIFKAFMQIEEATTKQHAGTGLGLYLVNQMLEILGGRISVSSEEGKGSTFVITFPSSIFEKMKPEK